MKSRRVVITGLGTVNPVGLNVNEFWSNCLSGKTNIEPIPRKWENYCSFNSKYWSPLPEIDYLNYNINRSEIRSLDIISLLSIVSVEEALKQSKIELIQVSNKKNTYCLKDIDSYRTGVFAGTGIGGINSLLSANSHQILCQLQKDLDTIKGEIHNNDTLTAKIDDIINRMQLPMRFNLFVVPRTMPNSVSANIGIKYSIKGVNESSTFACASGTIAIGRAFKSIQSGEIDLAITGAAEYLNDEYGCIFHGFDIAKTLINSPLEPENINCPFDKKRSGFLFSEGGAGFIILEELEHAQNRGVPILAEINGFAETFDAYSIMAPDQGCEEIKRLINILLERSGKTVREIDYINTHGTGTEINDAIEATVIDDIFGKQPYINSTKSIIGHTIGASGAIEVIATALSIRDQIVHASLNIDDPISDLNFARQNTKVSLNNALSLSYAFGGHNAGLGLSRFTP